MEEQYGIVRFDKLIDKIKEKARGLTKEDALMLYKSVPVKSRAYYIYKTRYCELCNEEAFHKAGTCKTVVEIEKLMNEYKRPIDEKDSMIRIESILRHRRIELIGLEAPARANNCFTASEAKKILEESPIGSTAEKIYETRWMELHLLEQK